MRPAVGRRDLPAEAVELALRLDSSRYDITLACLKKASGIFVLKINSTSVEKLLLITAERSAWP